jgi:hypothetical protein
MLNTKLNARYVDVFLRWVSFNYENNLSVQLIKVPKFSIGTDGVIYK